MNCQTTIYETIKLLCWTVGTVYLIYWLGRLLTNLQNFLQAIKLESRKQKNAIVLIEERQTEVKTDSVKALESKINELERKLELSDLREELSVANAQNEIYKDVFQHLKK